MASGERQLCRSQLVLEFCDTKPNNRTLLVYLMNPGAGVPVATAHIPIVTHACQIPQMAVWLPTIPDATQAQIVLLMEALDCGRAIVVNLTDVCEPDSSALGPRVTALANNTPRWDSLFHAPRHAELNNLLTAGPYVAMIGGWGALGSKQACLRDAASEVCARFPGIIGAPARSSYRNLGFRHPRPTAAGGPKRRYYGSWRKDVASLLNLSQESVAALSAEHTIDLLVDKNRIWTIDGNNSLNIDLSCASRPEGT
ncbi:hypothetical protein BON30_16465 [Cystobacter ferrugineus]|uniref:DUF1643 domain-containing protein n=2 Tax=Cystobacter ferrugineus TaxID=83449 RepID=A0A1L9BA45_9BACT|nr:hypothetical protein BON30_16465 [Cystobacter ferrugineus]